MARKSKKIAKRDLFVKEYLKDFNGRKAAIRAGYSPKGAAVQASVFLKIPKLCEEIAEGQRAREERVEVSADYILSRLKSIADTDIRQAYDEAGNLLPIHTIPDALARSISGIEVEELWDGAEGEKFRIGNTKKIKLRDSLKALEMLGKHLKMFTDKVEIDVADALAEKLGQAMKRANGATGT